MKIKWEDGWIAQGTHQTGLAHTLRVNGRRVSQDSHFIRAAVMSFTPRGGRSLQISFMVDREWVTYQQAQRHALEINDILPGGGTLEITLDSMPGGSEETLVATLQGAVFDGAAPVQTGIATPVQYNFRAPRVSGWSSPSTEEDNFVRSGSTPIGEGATDVAVTGLGYPVAPKRIVLTVKKSSSDGANIAAVLRGEPTSSGFTADLTGPASAGSSLEWIALL